MVGPRGALLGRQDGTFEAWIFPWKVFSGMRISALMQDYPVPIDVNRCAAEIEVRPDRTIITYAHANFTIRQIMLAPSASPENVGVLVLYQIEAIRPMTLTFSFDPVFERMWPAPTGGPPSPEWVKDGDRGGFYILHLNFPDHAAAIALPGAVPGILPPYQERAAAWPLQFVLHFDPARDSGKLYPLLLTVGETGPAAGKAALAESLAALDQSASGIMESNYRYSQNLLDTHTSLETPDSRLNEAFEWAIASIDELRIDTPPGSEHQALAAGFVVSGDTARPGFGWFFGRDALWSLYAIDSYGGFATARGELEFLAAHQRADGKIMHERSQTADLVDWASLPYQYASADATPLFLMAANDYLNLSGDTKFIERLWPNLQRAWNFETRHDSNDGIYDNREGTGWVESWVPSMPYQEIYLAALDEQASAAFAHLARAAGNDSLAKQAEARRDQLAPRIEQGYFLPALQNYAFSRNADGSPDNTATIFPSVAWWDGSYRLDHPEAMLERWASSEFSTDWGTRILSDRTSFYDPISYHQGTVWPLFTGWVSVAEYRAGHPLSGYAHLMQNVNLTWAQDPGKVTELLSGEFFQPLGRSTAHQLWSSAMVISPVLRGLFGLEWDAAGNTLTVTPQLPAKWPRAELHNLPFGDNRIDLMLKRHGGELHVTAKGGPAHLRLASRAPGATLRNGVLVVPLPAVEVGIEQSLPPFGSATSQLKVLREEYKPHQLILHLSAPAGAFETMNVRENALSSKLTAEGATLDPGGSSPSVLRIQFPAGTGYMDKVVTMTW